MDEDINDWSTIAAYFPHIDLDSIKEAITNTIDQNNFSVSDYALSNIVVQIAIALARIKQDHQIDSELYTLFLRDQDFKMAQSVCKAIASINNVVFTKNEITQIALLLAAICDKFNVVATMDNLSDYIWPDLYKLINNIADDLNRYYSIDLRKDSHNFVAFCLHIRCMVHRLTAGIHICNPYLETLKRKHIIVYDTAVYISYKISKHYNIAVNEDEISYLALYIGNVYETFLSSKTKVSALFILPNYHINQGLYLTYAKEFASQMNTYCVSSIDNCKNPEDYDIIISSNNLIYVGSNKAPHITISPLANNRDRSSIQNAIIEVRQKRSIKFIAEVF
ncbi:MAG: PRD domain-containing protein [Erysipelotrichaceae bacterium]|nr:PRD domain-containing protein [Erysipelotrichaceae bacterium]